MEFQIRWLVAVIGAGAVALSASAQGPGKLNVGPDAGGYLCPDGRQLYVKSCYDQSPGARCGIVQMHLPLNRSQLQVVTTETRASLIPSVAGCKIYPLEFRDGIVSLVVPKQQTAQAAPAQQQTKPPAVSARAAGDSLTIVDGIAIGTNNFKSSLVRLPTVAGTTPYFVDESSRRTTDQNGVASIWVLTVWPNGNPAFPARTRGVWTEYGINCKQQTYETTVQIALDNTATVLDAMTSSSRSTVTTGGVTQAIAQIACYPSLDFPWPRLPNAAAAIANGLAGPRPN